MFGGTIFVFRTLYHLRNISHTHVSILQGRLSETSRQLESKVVSIGRHNPT